MSRRLSAPERRVLATVGKKHIALALISGRRIHAIDLHLGKKWAGYFLPGDVMRTLEDLGLVIGHLAEMSGETTYHLTNRGREVVYRKKNRA